MAAHLFNPLTIRVLGLERVAKYARRLAEIRKSLIKPGMSTIDRKLWEECQTLVAAIEKDIEFPAFVGMVRANEVWVIDGKQTMIDFDMDWHDANNSREEPSWVGKVTPSKNLRQIWIDSRIQRDDWPFNLYHECREAYKMDAGEHYDAAHDAVNVEERELRRESQSFGTAELPGEVKSKIIHHEDGKWILYSHEGKILGRHDSKEDAIKQEQAIDAAKHTEHKAEGMSEADGSGGGFLLARKKALKYLMRRRKA